MTQDKWQDCSSIKLLAEAQERGDEIEVGTPAGFTKWMGIVWCADYEYRCRPAKPKVKTVVMREVFYWNGKNGWYGWLSEGSHDAFACYFVRYTGNERTEEMPE